MKFLNHKGIFEFSYVFPIVMWDYPSLNVMNTILISITWMAHIHPLNSIYDDLHMLDFDGIGSVFGSNIYKLREYYAIVYCVIW